MIKYLVPNNICSYIVIITIFIGASKYYYSIPAATTRNEGRYYCQVKNKYGEVTSAPATVTVITYKFSYSELPVEKLTNSLSELIVSQKEDTVPSADFKS